MVTMLSPLDYVLLHLGNPGRYQIFVAFLLCFLQIPISFSGMVWKYYTEEPPHRCLVKNVELNRTNLAVSESEWFPILRQQNKVKTLESCVMYIDPYNHWKGTQNCIYGWQYRPPENEVNLIIEYDLVCERQYLLNSLFYLYHLTAIFGSIVFAMIADRCERKTSLLMSLYLFISAAISIHFVTDFLQFSILFSLQTFFVAGLQIASYVLLIEVFATPYQLRASLYSICFNISATLVLPLLVWTIRNWRYIQIAIFAPCTVFLTYIWLLPQSPLWLVVEGKLHSAENLIERLAKQNGRIISPSFRLHLQNLFNSIKVCPTSQSLRHRILPKFSSPGLRWCTLVHFYLFFVIGLTTDVTEPQTIKLNENRNANNFYRGLMDLGSAMILYQFTNRFGSRIVQSFILIVSGALLMASIAVEKAFPNKYEVDFQNDFDYRLLLLPSTLILMARTLIISVPALTWFHAVKTMPTGIRAVGLASCFAWTQIGQMAAPHLVVLSELIAPYIPIGLCGSLLVCGGGLSLLFPNCNRRPLPNTLEEAENKGYPASLKHRYPSFRDMKNGRLYSVPVSASGLNPNVYTIAPNGFDKTNVKQSQHSNVNQIYEQKYSNGLEIEDTSNSLNHIRPNGLYNEDTDSRLSDLEEDINESNNWRLFANDFNVKTKTKSQINKSESYDINPIIRDITPSEIMGRPSVVANRFSNGLINGRHIPTQPRDSVAETNL